MEVFKLPPELNLRENAVNNWKNFKQRFEIYLEAFDNTKVSDKRKVAIFLNFIGEEALDVFNTFKLIKEKLTLEQAFEAFEDYLKPRTNVVIERHKFLTRVQKQNEPFDDFLNDLKKLVKSCDFRDQEESLMRDRIIIAVNDEALQQRMLRNSDLTLKKATDSCRASELSKQQQRVIQTDRKMAETIEVDVLRRKDSKGRSTSNQGSQRQQSSENAVYNCKKCGYNHKKAKCPAYGNVCNKCGKLNHFAAGCLASDKRQNVNELQYYEVNDFYVDAIQRQSVSECWVEFLKIGGKVVKFKLDSGSDCNVLPITVFNALKIPNKPKVKEANITLESYFKNLNANCVM